MLVLRLSSSPLLLLIIFRISSTLALSSRRNNTHRPGIALPRLNNEEDYGEIYDEITSTTSKPLGTPGPTCHYDICKEQEVSCEVLAQKTGCSCPGVSGHHEVPDPPFIKSLDFESPYEVVLRWCAPASVVLSYNISVMGQNQQHQLGGTRRMMKLGNLAPGSKVCVQAINQSGVSAMVKKSCISFEPRRPDIGIALRLGLIFGVAVLVLLLVLGLVVWRCRKRKLVAHTENQGSMAGL